MISTKAETQCVKVSEQKLPLFFVFEERLFLHESILTSELSDKLVISLLAESLTPDWGFDGYAFDDRGFRSRSIEEYQVPLALSLLDTLFPAEAVVASDTEKYIRVLRKR